MRCFYVLEKWSSAKLSLNRDLSLNKMSLNRDCTGFFMKYPITYMHDDSRHFQNKVHEKINIRKCQ